MSYHSSFDYDYEKEITPALIDELVHACQANREYYTRMHGEDSWIGTYGVSTVMDELCINIGYVLEKKLFTEEKFLGYFKTHNQLSKVRSIVHQVITRLGFEPSFASE